MQYNRLNPSQKLLPHIYILLQMYMSAFTALVASTHLLFTSLLILPSFRVNKFEKREVKEAYKQTTTEDRN